MARPVRLTSTLRDLRPAPVVDGPVRLTGREVADGTAMAASWLHDRGVVPGDVVVFRLANRWETILLLRACWQLGAVAFPVHHRAADGELEHLADRAGAAIVLTGDDLAFRHAPAPVADVHPDDLAVLLATSGSSGTPKIVRHTHGALAYKARLMVGVHGLSASDAVLMPAPLAHISGLLNGVLLPGAAGMLTVLVRRWDADEARDLIDAERVTFMAGPPTFFVDLLEAGLGDSTLRVVSTGGATVTPDLVDAVSHRFGAYVKRTYGSTEAPTITTAHDGDPVERARDTDGRPTGAVELRLRRDGELEVRGPELFVGYDDPAATAEALDPDGWFRTGDLARIDGEWLTIIGRATDTIIRGGENVSPAEVEAVCARLPGVRETVVVGYPDDRLGERVALIVSADHAPSADEVRTHCLEAGLAPFKIPDRVVAVPTIPRLPTGKPDRGALSAQLT